MHNYPEKKTEPRGIQRCMFEPLTRSGTRDMRVPKSKWLGKILYLEKYPMG